MCIRPRFEKSVCPAEPVKIWSIISICGTGEQRIKMLPQKEVHPRCGVDDLY